MNYFAIVMQMLRERNSFMEEIYQGIKIKSKITGLFISSSIFFAFYGLIMGAYGHWYQSLVSAIKLPALYLLTLIICFPTLYLFNVLFGSKCNAEQYLCLLMSAMGLISILLCGFAPITVFFLLSIPDYHFYLLLNVVIMGITGLFGIQFFYEGMKQLMKIDDIGYEIRHKILLGWLFLYGIIGSQLSWTLRPFMGTPGEPFQLFRPLESNFYSAVFKSFIALFN
ncbi:hypothetical protein [Roseofilum capinflatum]|uniref:Actin-binding WH2 domain-containing protein n=1 Tax=Roseofilum capinflatum BLCC-M114 TaxID=3022440 RepID=A0ABT7BD36_9CYAN|nr:hypothetical protein [Roseofilum capinflatum]MDJ1177102.1 actin-binding WH2 domain-containing protein [Roseofilum capinflatum BLCC-M114]